MTKTSRRGRGFARGAAAVAVSGWMATVAVEPAQGQQYDVGVGAGFFIDVPEPFQEEYCEVNAAGLSGSAAWRLLDWFVVEGSAIVSGQLGGETCAIPALAPIPTDTPIVETSYEDGVEGVDFFQTQAAVVLEPFPSWSVSPRARIGAGWIWQKNLLNWTLGAGLKYRFGPYAFYTDVDRWATSIDELNETVIYRSGGGRELQSAETISREFTTWVVRAGLEFAFPR